MSTYELSGQSWSQPTIYWYYTGNAAYAGEIAEAFARWDAEIGLDFVQAASASAATMTLNFATIDGPSNTLGRATSYYNPATNFYTKSSIAFDSAETWTWSAAAGSYVLTSGVTFYSVALHEIGHAIGLDHPTEAGVLMYPTASASVPDLTYWDIYAGQQIYGTDTAPVSAGSVSISDVTITEGDAGTKYATFTVTRTDGTSAFAVNFKTSNGTAVAGSDYTSKSGTLNFASNVNTQEFTVALKGDAVIEGNETFNVTLATATNGATISDTTAIGTIQNDDFAGTVSISDVEISESSTGTQYATFTVTRSGGNTAFAVNFATSNGTAVSGTDYAATKGTLSFAANVNTQKFTVALKGDTLLEADEAFNVTLSGSTKGASIDDGLAIGTILNDDTMDARTISGTSSHNVGLKALTGDARQDTILGLGGNDELNGFGGNDVLIGGSGRDTMVGGDAADVFEFNAYSETGKLETTRDIITDFVSGVDAIDLNTIDASTKVRGNQEFNFIGAEAFHNVAGELHYTLAAGNLILEGDVNGDGKADFQIQLNGISSLTVDDIIR